MCGTASTFSGFTANLRESGFCSTCGAFNRQRQIAHVVRQRLGIQDSGPLRIPESKVVYNTETTGAVDNALRSTPGYLSSEYFGPDVEPGASIEGRRHEDLQRLTFASDSIDLVLSSDVLEHMPEPYLAHREIFRVLQPGGRHIFTVPFAQSQPRDDVRAELVDGSIRYLAEKLFHGDPVRPNEGVLVWTIFGMEMMVKIGELGFEVSAWDVHRPDLGILGHMPLVFEARKPIDVDRA